MARKKLDPNEPHAAPQVTLRGLNAYVFQSLAERRGGEPADTLRWIFESWLLSEDGKRTLSYYGVDPLAYRSNVVPIGRGKREGG
jgi:hypothetical protein